MPFASRAHRALFLMPPWFTCDVRFRQHHSCGLCVHGLATGTVHGTYDLLKSFRYAIW